MPSKLFVKLTALEEYIPDLNTTEEVIEDVIFLKCAVTIVIETHTSLKKIRCMRYVTLNINNH